MLEDKQVLFFVHPQRMPPQFVTDFWRGKRLRTVMQSFIAGRFACVTFLNINLFRDERGNINFSCKEMDEEAEEGNIIYEEIQEGLIVGYKNNEQ